MIQSNASQLRLGPLEEGLLEQAGVLRGNPLHPGPAQLSDDAIRVFVLVAGAGAEGLAITQLPRALRARWTELALELELHALVARERNAQGHYSHLVITWQGQEALQRAKEHSGRPKGWASRRRATLNHAAQS